MFVWQDFPETLQFQLNEGHAVALRFNDSGTYLAAGLLDGRIVIWDFITREPIVELKGHTRPIQSIVWTPCGRYILSAARDWRVTLWDLSIGDGKRLYSVKLGAPVWGADLHPKDMNSFVASLYEDRAVLVRQANDDQNIQILTVPSQNSSSENTDPTALAPATTKRVSTLCTIFDSTGNVIYAGTTAGKVHIIDSESLYIKETIDITGSGAVKQIRRIKSGGSDDLVLNTTDRVIRTMKHTPDGSLVLEHKFQDVVNRVQWNACGFSAHGDYVIASTYGHSRHDIYIWERLAGSLTKILEGPNEEFIDVEWHPAASIVVASGIDSGIIYGWGVTYNEGWSAFAPDFKELEENEEYEEREDEFDIHDEETSNSARAQQDIEDNLDISTLDIFNKPSFSIPIKITSLLPVAHQSTQNSQRRRRRS